MGGPCVRRIPNAKRVVKCWIILNEVKDNTSAGKYNVLPVCSTIIPKRTGVSWKPKKEKKTEQRRE